MVAAEVMDGALVRRCLRLAADALGQTRSAIDALNVYPVPDADTGTNLYRTLRSAADAVDALPATASPAEVWRAAADGAMLGACGNSGIIVSQLLRGLAEVCGPATPCDGPVVARALGHAARLARSAVSRPAEGTVLSVADAAAAAVAPSADQRAAAGASAPFAELTPATSLVLADVVAGAARAARLALSRTTGQLAALAASGVVDSGAAGLCVMLDAWAAAIAGTTPARYEVPAPAAPVDARSAGAGPVPGAGWGAAAPSYGYEVTYLLTPHVTADLMAAHLHAAERAVDGLREELEAMGDSLVIAGGAGLSSVHVHVPEAGPAIEAGLRAGRLRRITVTYLGPAGDPGAEGSLGGAARQVPESHAVLALCATAGLAALARSAGAEVFRYESGVAPSAADLCAAVRPLGRRCIIVPDGGVTRAAAVAAAAILAVDGIEARVVAVDEAARALPALAVHEPQAGFGADAAAMDRAAARMRCASVGAGASATQARAVVDGLLVGGAEVLTLLTGADTPAGLVDWVTARAGELSGGAEIEWHAVAPAGVALLAGAE